MRIELTKSEVWGHGSYIMEDGSTQGMSQNVSLSGAALSQLFYSMQLGLHCKSFRYWFYCELRFSYFWKMLWSGFLKPRKAITKSEVSDINCLSETTVSFLLRYKFQSQIATLTRIIQLRIFNLTWIHAVQTRDVQLRPMQYASQCIVNYTMQCDPISIRINTMQFNAKWKKNAMLFNM